MGLWHTLAGYRWMTLVIPSKHPPSAYPWPGWFYISISMAIVHQVGADRRPQLLHLIVLLTGNDGRFRLCGFHVLQFWMEFDVQNPGESP